MDHVRSALSSVLPQRGDRRLGAAVLTSLLLVLPAALVVGGCATTAAREPYVNTFATKEDVARAVVEAFFARDTDRLASLAVSEVEFRKNIWPELPASRPEVGMPIEYLWGDMAAKSRGYLAELMAQYGGRRFELTSVTFGGPAASYGTFQIHPETRLDVVDEAGRASTLRLFGSMLEADGQWKIFSFVVD